MTCYEYLEYPWYLFYFLHFIYFEWGCYSVRKSLIDFLVNLKIISISFMQKWHRGNLILLSVLASPNIDDNQTTEFSLSKQSYFFNITFKLVKYVYKNNFKLLEQHNLSYLIAINYQIWHKYNIRYINQCMEYIMFKIMKPANSPMFKSKRNILVQNRLFYFFLLISSCVFIIHFVYIYWVCCAYHSQKY